MRADLLALSDDDLVALTNRGTVKRARQEVESLTVELSEDADGTVTARWSDAALCTIPAGKPLAAGRCDCSAAPPCRHLVRTVFAYQSQTTPAAEDADAAPPPGPWDPGAIADDALAAVATKAALTRAARLTGDGQVFELVRALRPVARCHSAGVTVRFLVSGDPAYALCDCGQPAPCEHAIAAIRAFRQLPDGAAAGLVECGATPTLTVSEGGALASAEAAVVELAQVGIADAPPALLDRLRRAEDALRRQDLVWPADLIADLLLLQDAYVRRDARFAPDALAQTFGEWAVRGDALRAATGAAPQLFVRGSRLDRTVEIASARLVGLGCAATPLPRGVRLTALMQEESSGHTVAVVREFDTADGRDYATLARSSAGRGLTLADIGRSHLLVKGGKRAPSGAFTFGRAPLSAHPQAFAWEKLRAPLLADGFAEVAARLSALPPVALRPRQLGEGLHVVPVAAVDAFGFDPAEQATVAQLRDPEGGEALLVHPFRNAASGGTSALLAALESGRVAFVAGRFRMGARALTVEPVGVVAVGGDSARRLVQPHIDTGAAASSGVSTAASAPLTPARVLGDDLPALLGEWLTVGAEASGEREARRTRELARTARAVGLAQTAAALERLAQERTAPALLELAALVALASE